MMTEALTYPDYIGADAERELDQDIMSIGEALINHRAQFLFGAGMSRSSLVPTAVEILDRLLDTFFPFGGRSRPDHNRLKLLAKEYPFEAILEAMQNKPGKGREALTAALKQILIRPDAKPSSAHNAFVSLCWEESGKSRLPAVFTTNFDDLLQQAFGTDRTKTITEDNVKDIKEAQRTGLIPILHLHGTLDKSYQATETDVFDQPAHVLYKEFEMALHYSDAFVFVGYSMTDPDFRDIYMKFRNDIRAREKRESNSTFVVSPPDDEFSYNLGKHVWRARGAIWIPLKAEEFFARLKHLMKARYYAEVRREVKKHYSLEDDRALEGRIDTTAETLRLDPNEALLFLHEVLSQGGGK